MGSVKAPAALASASVRARPRGGGAPRALVDATLYYVRLKPDATGIQAGRYRGVVQTNAGRYWDMALVIFTIGHSTRPVAELIRLLRAHGVRRLVDVRTMPRSRHNPQFNRERLSRALHGARIHYRHMPGLGGLRRPKPDSTNAGWRNTSFRGYADYMQTESFADNLQRLIELARREPTVLMCAEAVPWRCHRSLIADALVVQGIEVREIVSGTRAKSHTLTPWARVVGTLVTYPAASSAAT